MAIERERKFLLLNSSPLKGIQGVEIEQAYLLLGGPAGNKHLRVRIVDNTKAYLTYKSILSSTDRLEYEYEIPLEDAREMINQSDIKLRKRRYSTQTDQGDRVDIDTYYQKLEGTMVVEIEFKEDLQELPDYCGEELTDNPMYSNINIAKSGISW